MPSLEVSTSGYCPDSISLVPVAQAEIASESTLCSNSKIGEDKHVLVSEEEKVKSVWTDITLRRLKGEALTPGQEVIFGRLVGLDLDNSISWKGNKMKWREVSELPKRGVKLIRGPKFIGFMQERTRRRLQKRVE